MLEIIRNAWKIADLRKKILYSLMIILIFRIGSHITVPFLDPYALGLAFQGSGSLGLLDIITGGNFSQGTIFALSISPYITSSIITQLLTVAIPALERLSKEGAEGRKKLAKITRWGTLVLGLMQSIAYYVMNRSFGAVLYTGKNFSGVFAAIVIVSSFTAGSLLIVWLGELIDKRGIGNGISMILFAGIISRGPDTIMLLKQYWDLGATGATQYYFLVPAVVILFLALITAIVLMTNAERRIPIQYAKRVVGRKMYGGHSSYIPIKVTMSGVLPIIFASSLLSIPSLVLTFTQNVSDQTGWFFRFLRWFNYDNWGFAVLYLILIIAFNYFYIAIQYNPLEMANDLRKNNGTIPGIRAGKPTAEFIARVIGKITLVGGLFIAGVAILPIVLGAASGMNISLGGTSIIIVVGVALDTVRQLESQMMMRHYKGFLE